VPQDKFAFSVIWRMKADGEIISEWFGKSVIHNYCRCDPRGYKKKPMRPRDVRIGFFQELTSTNTPPKKNYQV